MLRKVLYNARYSILSTVVLGSGIAGVLYLNYESGTAMRESPKDASMHLKSSIHESQKSITKKDVATFHKRGLVVIDNFISNQDVLNAKDEIDAIMLDNKLFSQNDNDDLDVRSDIVLWISEAIGDYHERHVIKKGILYALQCMRSVPYELELLGFSPHLLGVPFINQLACYDGLGTHYIPHFDSHQVADGEFVNPLKALMHHTLQEREITIILYLNDENWDSNAGGLENSGHLRCHLEKDENGISEIVDIQPVGGRLIIFNSKTIMHEVCPSMQRRRAITCWIGGRHSKYQWMRAFFVPVDEVNWSHFWDQHFQT